MQQLIKKVVDYYGIQEALLYDPQCRIPNITKAKRAIYYIAAVKLNYKIDYIAMSMNKQSNAVRTVLKRMDVGLVKEFKKI